MPKKTGRDSKKQQAAALSARNRIIIGAGILLAALIGIVIPFTAMQFENHDSFCASCHTEGEVTFYNRSLVTSAHTTDLASYHAAKQAARCIDCHTGPGIIGRYGGLMAGSTDLISYFSGHYPQPAVLEEPYPDANCLKCHADLTSKEDFNNHFHYFLSTWQSSDPHAAGCVDCHSSHDANNPADIMFLDQVKTQQICQNCHAAVGG